MWIIGATNLAKQFPSTTFNLLKKDFISKSKIVNNSTAAISTLCKKEQSLLLCSGKGNSDNLHRYKNSYPPDVQFDTPSPYKGTGPQLRYRWQYQKHTGGVLPRPDSYKDIPVKGLPEWNAHEKDAWVKKKALFGQNDYIDILGDGTIHPRDLLSGPSWVRGNNVNEYKRIVRQFAYQNEFLREHRPAKYHAMSKHLFFLYKTMNRRKRANHWGNNNPKRLNSTDKYNKSRTWSY